MADGKQAIRQRLKAAFRAEVVSPEPQYIRRTAEERRELIRRTFNLEQPEEQEEPPGAPSPEAA